MANVLVYNPASRTRSGRLPILGDVSDFRQDVAAEGTWGWKLVGWITIGAVSALGWAAIILSVEYFVR
jgi:hypothetical protein